jgi:hypothetical protein
MKKSEIIQKIVEILKENTDQKYFDTPPEFTAREIFTMLEKSGIKGPVVKKCPVLHTNIHTWDKEE